ncbi:MAG: NUDIX hydrolase [Bacteroidales bacterium]
MYKVFFNDSLLLVTANNPTEQNIEIRSFTSPVQVEEWIASAQKSAEPIRWALLTDQPRQAWAQVLNHFPFIEAAGGLVNNQNGKYLFIYRRKRWDLPKGKVDAGEVPQQTALREVEEETGLSPLVILKFLTHTYHIYLLKERFTLKRTHWYLMQYGGNKSPIPQTNEDIERVEWMALDDFTRMSEPTFGTVLEVIGALTGNR